MAAASLVTLTQAKDRLRVVISDEDADIQRMIEEASAAVVARVDNTDVTDLWLDDASTPREAQAAVLEVIVFLFERDTMSANQQRDDHRGLLPARAERVLYRLIKPALA